MTATGNNTVSFIIINLNGKHLLDDLLVSLAELDYPRELLEIIMVDNGSSDGSADYLEKNHPEVKLIKNPKNLGFAYPCNQGASKASGEYLAFINNDMRLDRRWVVEMLDHIDKDSNSICVGSKILNFDGTKIDFVGGSVNFIGMGYQKNFGKDFEAHDETDPKEILFACGGAMLIDKKIFLEIGGFDEDYFAFFEDVDLGWRLWVLGYRVVFAPTAISYHKHHQTAKRISEKIIRTLYERNSLYTVYKNYDESTLRKAFPAAFVMASMRLVDSFGLDTSEYLINGPDWIDRSMKKKHNTVKKAYRKIVTTAMETVASFLLDFRFSTRLCVRNRRKHSFSPAMAMAQFGFNIERMKEKRDYIQTNRKRSDSEIIELFSDSFGLENSHPKYNRLVNLFKNLPD